MAGATTPQLDGPDARAHNRPVNWPPDFQSDIPAAPARVLDLWPEGVPGFQPGGGPERMLDELRVANIHRPTLAWWPAPAARANGTAAVVCPGGGYVRLAVVNDGELVARWLNSLGVSAFVLKSRLVEYGAPAPLQDVLRALRTVRAGAAEFGVRADRVGALGFSAGGHLAACAALLHAHPLGKTGAALDAANARPDFAGLIYPVVTMAEPFMHAGSRDALLGPAPAPEQAALWSVERQVTPDAPPFFLAHAQDDDVVPVENSLTLYAALRRAGVPAELHLYEAGGHSHGLLSPMGGPGEWPRRMEDWLRRRGLLERP
jgi:acetyl esterase/lipase